MMRDSSVILCGRYLYYNGSVIGAFESETKHMAKVKHD